MAGESDPAAGEGPVHASCVAFRRAEGVWSGVLIRAPSGGGKSGFALRLIALGARLVADDRTALRLGARGRPVARAPESLRGVIEARGLGLLRLPALPEAEIDWVVALAPDAASERLPPRREAALLGVSTPLLSLKDDDRAAAALCCLVRDGALLDPEAGLADFNG